MRHFLYDYITDLAVIKKLDNNTMENVYFIDKAYLSRSLFHNMNAVCFISQNINYIVNTDYLDKAMPIINEYIMKDNFTINIDKLLK